ncbi:hypothetical protein BST95_05990 [Halioglobus japonicus]|uniref:Phosphohydrolase n=1 Tax=Halioglobus japonicus TaxID=930805 RepID=A0AAP8SMS0_9GAMM|nr:MSMEG_1061 family FMN-dependent PPOX-type flavoprotein [Halioglobus japonicus]AQA17853.1 hypothetical protein BST95_05990 [Halioglobus japonicus]PLW85814.1 phosphohydrolase [Halioglobus japonicus]GHD17634.1 phosphohydrolase [Halioglobus japonicus]
MSDEHLIDYEAKLEALIGAPLDIVKAKVVSALDDPMRKFVASSPLAFVSTIDAQGRADISPKGDPAGFTWIDDKGNLIIPERPGNKLTFGFRNILRDNRIGLIFVVPGMRETLRVKGTATLRKDPDMLEQFQVNNKPALMYTYVEVEECFFHCGKAMIRSNLWKPEKWGERGESLMVRQISAAMGGDAQLEKVLEEEIEKNYKNELY